MALGDRTHDRQAEPAATGFACLPVCMLAAVEALEHTLTLGPRKVRPAVDHVQQRMSADNAGLDIDTAAGWRVSQGAFDQVGQQHTKFRLLTADHHLVRCIGAPGRRQSEAPLSSGRMPRRSANISKPAMGTVSINMLGRTLDTA